MTFSNAVTFPPDFKSTLNKQVKRFQVNGGTAKARRLQDEATESPAEIATEAPTPAEEKVKAQLDYDYLDAELV